MNSERTVKNLMWRFFEKCGAQLVSFIVSIILARKLGPDAYGTVALVTVFTTILTVFIDSGLGVSLVQKKDADNLDFSSVFYFNIVICTTLYLIMFFCAPLIANFYEKPELTAIIRVLCLTLVISGVRNIQQSYISKNLLFKKFFAVTISATIISGIVGVVIVYQNFGVWALVAQTLMNQLVGTIILWITVEWRPVFKFSFSRLKGLFSYGWKLLVSGLLDTIYKEVRQLIIGKKYTSTDLGFYNKGQQFPNLIILNINASIDSVLLPTIARVQDNKEDVKRMTRRAIKTSSFILWPTMVGLAVCATPLVKILLTDTWIQCVPYLQIFCFTSAFYPIHTANLNAIKAMGRSDMFLKLEIIKKTIGVIAILVSMWYGVFWIAFSLLFTTVISSFVNAYPNKKLMNYSYFEQVKDMLPAMILSVIMGAIVYLVQFIELSSILTLVIQVPLGVVIYLGIAYLLKFESLIYVFNTIKSVLKRRKNTVEQKD